MWGVYGPRLLAKAHRCGFVSNAGNVILLFKWHGCLAISQPTAAENTSRYGSWWKTNGIVTAVPKPLGQQRIRELLSVTKATPHRPEPEKEECNVKTHHIQWSKWQRATLTACCFASLCGFKDSLFKVPTPCRRIPPAAVCTTRSPHTHTYTPTHWCLGSN